MRIAPLVVLILLIPSLGAASHRGKIHENPCIQPDPTHKIKTELAHIVNLMKLMEPSSERIFSNLGQVHRDLKSQEIPKLLARRTVHDLRVLSDYQVGDYLTVRELVANAIDANFLGADIDNPVVRINTDQAAGLFQVQDSGEGMDLDDLLFYLLTPSRSKNQLLVNPKMANKDVSGRFGQGFFSIFSLLKEHSDVATVITRKKGSPDCWKLKLYRRSKGPNQEPEPMISMVRMKDNECQEHGTQIKIQSSLLRTQYLDKPAVNYIENEIIKKRFQFNQKATILLNDKPVNQLDKERRDWRIFGSPQKHGTGKLYLVVNGIVIHEVDTQGVNIYPALVLDLPTQAKLTPDRTTLDMSDPAITEYLKKVIQEAIQHKNITLLNSIYPMIKSNPDFLAGLESQFEGLQVLPAFESLKNITEVRKPGPKKKSRPFDFRNLFEPEFFSQMIDPLNLSSLLRTNGKTTWVSGKFNLPHSSDVPQQFRVEENGDSKFVFLEDRHEFSNPIVQGLINAHGRDLAQSDKFASWEALIPKNISASTVEKLSGCMSPQDFDLFMTRKPKSPYSWPLEFCGQKADKESVEFTVKDDHGHSIINPVKQGKSRFFDEFLRDSNRQKLLDIMNDYFEGLPPNLENLKKADLLMAALGEYSGLAFAESQGNYPTSPLNSQVLEQWKKLLLNLENFLKEGKKHPQTHPQIEHLTSSFHTARPHKELNNKLSVDSPFNLALLQYPDFATSKNIQRATLATIAQYGMGTTFKNSRAPSLITPAFAALIRSNRAILNGPGSQFIGSYIDLYKKLCQLPFESGLKLEVEYNNRCLSIIDELIKMNRETPEGSSLDRPDILDAIHRVYNKESRSNYELGDVLSGIKPFRTMEDVEDWFKEQGLWEIPELVPYLELLVYGKETLLGSKTRAFPGDQIQANQFVPVADLPIVRDAMGRDKKLINKEYSLAFAQNPNKRAWIQELLKNSIEAKATTIDLSMGVNAAGELIAEFTDNGMGVDPSELYVFFIPKLSTKKPDKKDINFGWGFFTLFNFFDEVSIQTSSDGVKQRTVHLRMTEKGLEVFEDLSREGHFSKGTRISGKKRNTGSLDSTLIKSSFLKETLAFEGLVTVDHVDQRSKTMKRLQDRTPLYEAEVSLPGQATRSKIQIYPGLTGIYHKGLLQKETVEQLLAPFSEASKRYLEKMQYPLAINIEGYDVKMTQGRTTEMGPHREALAKYTRRQIGEVLPRLIVRNFDALELPYDFYYNFHERKNTSVDQLREQIRKEGAEVFYSKLNETRDLNELILSEPICPGGPSLQDIRRLVRTHLLKKGLLDSELNYKPEGDLSTLDNDLLKEMPTLDCLNNSYGNALSTLASKYSQAIQGEVYQIRAMKLANQAKHLTSPDLEIADLEKWLQQQGVKGYSQEDFDFARDLKEYIETSASKSLKIKTRVLFYFSTTNQTAHASTGQNGKGDRTISLNLAQGAGWMARKNLFLRDSNGVRKIDSDRDAISAIDYTVTHELTHTTELPNEVTHDRRFFLKQAHLFENFF